MEVGVVVVQRHLHRENPVVPFQARQGKDPPPGDAHPVLNAQMHRPVQTAAFIPPALVYPGIAEYGQDVVPLAEHGKVGDVHFKGGVAAVVAVQRTAVQVHGAVGGRPLKIQGDALLCRFVRQAEMQAVPAAVIVLVAPGLVLGPVKRAADDKVMGEGDGLPVFAFQFTGAAVVVYHVPVAAGGGAEFHPLGFGRNVGGAFGSGQMGGDVS